MHMRLQWLQGGRLLPGPDFRRREYCGDASGTFSASSVLVIGIVYGTLRPAGGLAHVSGRLDGWAHPIAAVPAAANLSVANLTASCVSRSPSLVQLSKLAACDTAYSWAMASSG